MRSVSSSLSCALALALSPLPLSAAPPPEPPPVVAPPQADLPAAAAMPEAFDRCERHRGNERFRITLPKAAELEDLVHWMSSVSCQKFIWEPSVRGGKATILAPEPVTVAEAYAAFHAALQTMGLTVENAGDFYKIVESTDAATRALPLYGSDDQAPVTDRYVTQLYRVRAAAPEQLRTVLEGVKSKSGRVDAVGELLIVTDTGTNVARMRRLLEEIDRANLPQERIYLHGLQHAEPEAVAALVQELFGGQASGTAAKPSRPAGERTAGGAKTPATTASAESPSPQAATASRVLVDEHTRALVIVARPADYAVIAKLIERIDVPPSGAAARFHLVPLVNADPEEVANTLMQLASGASKGAGAAGKDGARPTAAGGTAPSFGADIRVTPDLATRSLVIYATQADYLTLAPIIEGLDAERRQVYIEVYLLELSVDKLLQAGAGAHFGASIDANVGGASGQGLGFVASAPDASHNSLLLDSSVLSGLAAGVLGPLIPGSGALTGLSNDVPAFGVIIQALSTDDDVNVVAEPHIYTADNREALIEVGDQKPVPGAISYNPGGSGTGSSLVPFQQIQQRDIKLSLKVTPHVNDEDTVSLDVELDNENFVESSGLGVSTTKRKLKLEHVLAHDGQPLVLGGLMKEVERDNHSGVPGLSKVPLLGWAFKSRKRRREKVNLLMIMVPHVLSGPDDMRRIHKRRMEERLEFLERYTAFKRRDLDTAVNYSRKSGLLTAVNAEATRMLDQSRARTVAEQELQRTEVSAELGMVPPR
ncbi:MAG: type II secretion system secretin GspD [Nannocystaceae bacterium]|nr:type II secretion system secretin GspD [Nannocystaceae bacterium]